MNANTETSLLDIKGISVTPIRLLVLQTFLKHPQAFSLKDLEEKLFFSERSTIFRTLQLFQKKGILHEILSSDGIKSYALCADCENESHNDQHAHLKCKECESVFCIPLNVNTLVAKSPDYQIDDIQIFVNGICKTCNSVA
ncbi:MAG: Fur family transcriptional regulator [Maribacter sp.]